MSPYFTTSMKKLLLIAIIAVCSVSAQTSYDSLYLKNSNYSKRIAVFEQSTVNSAPIVFFGNSITFGGDWNILLGRDSIINQGIVSDNTIGMLHRLRFVYQLQPTLCFIMAGINDIYFDVPVETIFDNYKKIIDTLRTKNIIPIVQSTLHVNPKWKRTEVKNPEVKKLNGLLVDYCTENEITFVDLNAALSTNGVLNDEYTKDGVHLSPAAYRVWSRMIAPILKQHGL